MHSSFRSKGLSNNPVNSVKLLTLAEERVGQYRAKPQLVEGVTTIQSWSRVQGNSKRRIPLNINKGKDIVWSSWRHEEKYCEPNISQHKRYEIHLPSVSNLALVKPRLIDLEAQKWVTGAKIYGNFAFYFLGSKTMNVDILGKRLRDILLGDATLSNPVSKNAGSILQINHEIKQEEWLAVKVNLLKECGLTFKVVDTEQDHPSKDGILKAKIAYTPSSKFLRFLYDRWYTRLENGKRIKNYEVMLSDYIVDMETFIILFLDNGCIDKRNGCLKTFIFSVNYQDSDLLANKLRNHKFAVRNYDNKGPKSYFALGTKRAKERFRVLVRDFCVKNNLQDTFSYKYDLPISCAERLNDGGCE